MTNYDDYSNVLSENDYANRGGALTICPRTNGVSKIY